MTQAITEQDLYWMRHALALAHKASLHQEVPVGAVLVLDNQCIGEGWNQPIATLDPSAHAEIIALRQGAQQQQNYRLPGCTLYVTLEPCAMCVGALVQARIARLVFGALDSKSGAVTSVFNLLAPSVLNHRIAWLGDCLAQESVALLQDFFQKRRFAKT